MSDFVPPYEGWAPFCLVCPSMARMTPREYGWECPGCHNQIKKDLTHYDGSPGEGHHAERPVSVL